MIITSEREHLVFMKPRNYWYCETAAYEEFVGHGLPPDALIHYRPGCARCFVGFMENARTTNAFTIGGVTKAVYNLEEARLWFFRLYKENKNEGE